MVITCPILLQLSTGKGLRYHALLRGSLVTTARHILRLCMEAQPAPMEDSYITVLYTDRQTPWPLVRKRTIQTEQPSLVDEI
jgi:hypothetical protein